MKTQKLSMMAMAAVMVAAQAMAQEAKTQATAPTAPIIPMAPTVKRVIVVSLEDRKLALVEDGEVKKVYSVAVGKPSTPSPTGTFTIKRRVMNPTYHHAGQTVAPGPRNPVGTRWMGLSIAGYGIHGTNEPNSIGKAASHGCIRMAKADLEEFYAMVEVGDTVELVGERNEETARMFGDEQKPGAPIALPMVVAAVAPAAGAVQETAAAEQAVTPAVVATTLTAMR
jgi:lipoprotein-anchoring transpeptidase ErfK/SrfK